MWAWNVLTALYFALNGQWVSFWNFTNSTNNLRRNLEAYPMTGSIDHPYTVDANLKANLSLNQKRNLLKEFRLRVETDGKIFFQSQRKRIESAVRNNEPGTAKIIAPLDKADPTIAISNAYLPKVVSSNTCTKSAGVDEYTCVPNKNVWTSNPGNFAFLYYNTLAECEANAQPFYFYSEMQTSCTAGIRQSCDKHTSVVTVKSYANMDCTGSVTTKYSYPLSQNTYPLLQEYKYCHDSTYSAGAVKIVCV